MLCNCKYPNCTNEMPAAKCKQWLSKAGYYERWLDDDYLSIAAKIYLGGPNAHKYGNVSYNNVVRLIDVIKSLYKERTENKGNKMTREEAVNLAKKFGYYEDNAKMAISLYEALGLIKFEEEKPVKLCSAEGDFDGIKNVKVEWIPNKGLILLINSEIVYRSWKSEGVYSTTQTPFPR